MSDLHDPGLDAFVELLRGATPTESTLQIARANVMAGAATPALGGALSILSRLGVLSVVVVALGTTAGLDPAPSAPKRARASAATAALVPQVAAPPAEPPIELDVPDPEPVGEPPVVRTVRVRAPARRERPRPALRLDVPTTVVIPSTGPSAIFVDGLRDYGRGRWAEAATQLEEVARGRTDDGPEQITEAGFFLAKCLYHLELFHASAAAFEEVTRGGANHPWFDESLPYLAMLSAHVPEPSLLIATVGRYDDGRIDAAPPRHHDELRWLLGRHLYEEGRYEEAARTLARVPRAHARFYEGLSHVQRHRAAPAFAAFRRITETTQNRSREYELAWMSIARLHYSLAVRQPAGSGAMTRHLDRAIAAWRHIPIESSRWLDAFFEETWAHYLANDAARALGHVHTLQSPELRHHSNPEAVVIRAMIQLEHCQWRSLEHTLASFHESYDPVLEAAERAHRMASSNEGAFRLLRAVRARRSRVPVAVRPAVHRALAGREIDRRLAAVSAIERERTMLDAMDTFGPELSARVATDLTIQHGLAVDRAGELTAERLRRLRDDLRERMLQMDTVEVELSRMRRDELDRPGREGHEPEGGGTIVAQQGGQVWPFDGEYWPDEMPHYRQTIRSRCGR